MDSVTQATLGAAIGEAVLGPRVGWKAAVWGGVIGTLPDLDVVIMPFVDTAGKLIWHRGPSHGFFFLAIAAPLIGLALNRIHRGRATWRLWTILAYLCLVMAVLVDAFTVYGTHFFEPFSRYPVAFNNLAIIDPLFTLPLLIGLIVALAMRRQSVGRRRAIFIGLGIAAAYTLWTFAVKAHVNDVTRENLAKENIEYTRYMTAPTLFNTLLWDIHVDIDTGFLSADYSLLDFDRNLNFNYIPRNDQLIAPYEATHAVQTLKWFSRGYYTVTQPDSQIQFNDIRFGGIGENPRDPAFQYIFAWTIEPPSDTGEVHLKRVDLITDNWQAEIGNIFNRMLGD